MARALRAVQSAAEKGADVIVLPEAFIHGWMSLSTCDQVTEIPNAFTEALSEAAKQYGIYIAFGLDECRNGLLFNSAVLLDDSGRILSTYSKINVVANAICGYKVHEPGRKIEVVDTKFGLVGLTICADSFEGHWWITEALVKLGAKTIFSPVAWAYPPDRDVQTYHKESAWIHCYRELCRNNQVNIIAADSVGKVEGGPWHGWNVVGGSLVFDASGNLLKQGVLDPAGEELIIVDID